jgi:hypothetical protein
MLNRPADFMGKKGTHLLSRHRELLSSPLLLHHLRWFGPATYTRDKYRAAAVQHIAQRSSASGEVLATHTTRLRFGTAMIEEKDFWVCWTLQRIFSNPALRSSRHTRYYFWRIPSALA